MDGTKPWYKSLTVWSNICTGAVGAYLTVAASPGVHLPTIPPVVISILSGVGLYGRVKATDKITS